jgi:hypothetical protein
MATSHAAYYQSVRAALTKAMCIRNLPCQLVRRSVLSRGAPRVGGSL